ncbi:hypothetical protein [Roseomonas mucosa]
MHAADIDLTSLPDDPAALRALLVAVVAERDALAERNERLRHLRHACQRRWKAGSPAFPVLLFRREAQRTRARRSSKPARTEHFELPLISNGR